MNNVTEHNVDVKVDDTYNGWTNYETWLVNLWLTNDWNSYDSLRHIVAAFETTSEQANELEHMVRYERDCYEEEPSMWRDLLGAALSHVNWHEIAENNQG